MSLTIPSTTSIPGWRSRCTVVFTLSWTAMMLPRRIWMTAAPPSVPYDRFLRVSTIQPRDRGLLEDHHGTDIILYYIPGLYYVFIFLNFNFWVNPECQQLPAPSLQRENRKFWEPSSSAARCCASTECGIAEQTSLEMSWKLRCTTRSPTGPWKSSRCMRETAGEIDCQNISRELRFDRSYHLKKNINCFW